MKSHEMQWNHGGESHGMQWNHGGKSHGNEYAKLMRTKNCDYNLNSEKDYLELTMFPEFIF